MTSQTPRPQPPRMAVWLVSLFTPTEEAESIPGDLLEEFSQVASNSGSAAAERWYWHQTVKTVVHLFGAGFRVAPWSTLAAVIGGFLLHRFVSGLPDKLLSAVTDRYLTFWSTHFNAYLWVLKGMLIAHLIGSMFVGSVIAMAAKGREMVATMTLVLVLGAMAIASLFVIIARIGDASFPWFLPLSFADSFAIIAGGAIVRTRRSASTPRLSNS